MTVLEVIQRSADFLSKKGVESPRLQVEHLLAHLLGMPRMKLYLNFDRVLSETELTQLRELVKRRGNREPLQHIVGSANFCGYEFQVNSRVLVPRPETELLGERAWNFLSTLNNQPSTVLDFGTGSGCLAITLALKCPNAKIHAVDISTDALAIAKENAVRHNVFERIEFHLGNGFDALPAGLQFNVIVSNPPYIPSEEIATLDIEVKDHDPKLALDGGADGLDFYRMLAEKAPTRLLSAGKLMVEFGDEQAGAIKNILEKQNWIVEAVERDYSRRERILIARLP